MDEVQLMDVGLATSAPTSAFREEIMMPQELRPLHTWWMRRSHYPAGLAGHGGTAARTSWRLGCSIIAADSSSTAERRLWDYPQVASRPGRLSLKDDGIELARQRGSSRSMTNFPARDFGKNHPRRVQHGE